MGYVLLLDGSEYYVPMATTEGFLVVSVSRGCEAIALSGGATNVVLRDGMTLVPVVRLPSASRAAELKTFLENPNNLETFAEVFNRCLVCLLLELSRDNFKKLLSILLGAHLGC